MFQPPPCGLTYRSEGGRLVKMFSANHEQPYGHRGHHLDQPPIVQVWLMCGHSILPSTQRRFSKMFQPSACRVMCRSEDYSKDATFSFQLLSFVPADATGRPTRRRRSRLLNMKFSTRRAARRVEPVGAHREFPRAPNAVRSRLLPQATLSKDATSLFHLLSFVATDATGRPTRGRRGCRLNVKFSTSRAAQRVEPVGAHREFPRTPNAVRSRLRPQVTYPKDATSSVKIHSRIHSLLLEKSLLSHL